MKGIVVVTAERILNGNTNSHVPVIVNNYGTIHESDSDQLFSEVH